MSLVLSRNGSWRWMLASSFAAILLFATLLTLQSDGASAVQTATPSASASQSSSPLARVAAEHPGRQVEVIVQLRPGTDPAVGRSLVQAAGGQVSRELPIINGLGTTLPAEEAQRLSLSDAVYAVSLNAKVESEAMPAGLNPAALGTAYNQSIRSDKVWGDYTGKGVGVAVIDTGIAGSLPDFQVSPTDPTSRVIATAVVNPAATNAGDSLGHGTHVAGLIAGNGANRPASDPLRSKYVGVAPEANLISVKAGDENGDATVMDVIDGLQFVVDKKADYNIRVVNLSLKSTVAESYKTDPLDAAVEAAWNSGIVVVVAAGNSGPTADAVNYAPANDPFVITVGGADDQGTANIADDRLASWSSRGVTQDGFEKPEIVAPGARLVSTMAPQAAYKQLCPTCVTDGDYFRVGGTSMAAAVASGEAALLVQSQPGLTPNQVKAQLIKRTRGVLKAQPTSDTLIDGQGDPVPASATTTTTVNNGLTAADKVVGSGLAGTSATPTMNTLLDPATGLIDYSRASWSRASWSDATDYLRASWSRASWSRASWSRASWSATPESCSEFERASWSRASWSRASWSRASWSRASWSADGMSAPDISAEDLAALDADIAAAKAQCSQLLASIDPSRASWSRASWSRASWSTSFDK